ncbi:AMP-dependent synthetase/ligase [Streptomyces sp. NPDC014733]|uniref:AMP-dependent synthetase/ligase n=1 Tax=Streptomyces sp. NPDC014733 TaxID=3364885 RepID=UPI003701CCED
MSSQDSAPPPTAEPALTVHDGTVREVALPPLVAPPARGSLGDLPFVNAAQAPGAVALARRQADGGWSDLTCAAFADEVRAVAKGLIAHGLRRGDRLALMARTTYEWTLIDCAAWAAGLITVPVHPTASAHQVAWILHDSGAAACVVESVTETRLITGVRGGLPGLVHLWQFDTGAVAQLVAAGRELPDSLVDERRAATGPSDLATLVYTSGTTGRPKGCALTHGNVHAEIDNAVALLGPVLRPDGAEPASTLLFLPLSHVFGRMAALVCLRARVRLGHAPSLRTADLLADLTHFRPTFLYAIPYVLEKVCRTGRAAAEAAGRAAAFDRAVRVARAYGEAVAARDRGTGKGPGPGLKAARRLYEPVAYRPFRDALGGRVRHVICGGAPLDRGLAGFCAGAGVAILEGYGLAETCGATTATAPLRPRPGTVGQPLPGSAVRIADDGEVLVRGGQIFAGYWEASRAAAVPATDGWFATGDLGALDPDGHLTLTGRKTDMIVTTGGRRIAPAPLEDRVRAHPLIAHCLVTGDNRPYVTALLTLDPEALPHWRRTARKPDLPLAALAGDPDLRATLQRAVDDANRLVSRPESIRRFAVLPVEFTERAGHLTPSRKLRRAAVTQQFADRIEELYEEPYEEGPGPG